MKTSSLGVCGASRSSILSLVLIAGPAAVLLGVTGPLAAAPLPLPAAQQALVDRAIDRGVDFLKSMQSADNTWTHPKGRHPIGYAALPALTLLECGVPAKDAAIRRAATFVRRYSGSLDTTYELSLAILFLDKLGDPKDEDLIQGLAIRLLTGQTHTGGWSYKCHRIGPETRKELVVLLRQIDPQPLEGVPANRKPDRTMGVEAAVPKPGPGGGPGKPGPGEPGGVTKPMGGGPGGGAVGKTGPAENRAAGNLPLPGRPAPNKAPGRKPAVPGEAAGPADRPPPVKIPAKFKAIVALHDPEVGVGESLLLGGITDNSNTQFATLALWVAQRHNVPLGFALARIARRFQASQNLDGSWGYHYRQGGGEPEKPAMDCVGLIGLAVGHAIARAPGEKGPPDKPVNDPRVVNGLVALTRQVGQPAGVLPPRGPLHLYALWSIERVAVLYDLPTIGGKDWYGWGCELLLANQTAVGSWENGDYPGHSPIIDTCLALLFLKRANLASDLTPRLPFPPKELALIVARQAGSALPPEPPSKSADPASKKRR